MTERKDIGRPGIGDAIPAIALEKPEGGTTSIAGFAGQPLVLFFYPKDNTPGCTTEAKDFTELAGDFARAGVALLGVSKDSPKSHQNFIRKHDLKTPLASDTEVGGAETGGAETGGLADTLGIWVEKNMYGRRYMGMERTTFLVDAEGRIARVWRKVKVKGHAAEVLEAAKAL